jgi:Domain of unknown function (DUF4398)
MKPISSSLSFIFIFFLASLNTPAQQMEMSGDFRVPVLRLMTTSNRIRVADYSQPHAETTVDFTGTALMPKAHGTAKVETAREGINVELHLEGLGPASQIDPAYLTYVLWAVPSNQNKPQNLGELVLDAGESTVKASTNLSRFAMIVTAEPYFAVKQPSSFVVLQNTFRARPEDAGVVRADLLPLRGDAKTPLDIYEARNAVRIARLAGAERYAAEPFHKALQLLQQAESIFAHKKGHDIPDVKEKAREATEAAEDARAVATERGQESSPLRP